MLEAVTSKDLHFGCTGRCYMAQELWGQIDPQSTPEIANCSEMPEQPQVTRDLATSIACLLLALLRHSTWKVRKDKLVLKLQKRASARSKWPSICGGRVCSCDLLYC